MTIIREYETGGDGGGGGGGAWDRGDRSPARGGGGGGGGGWDDPPHGRTGSGGSGGRTTVSTTRYSSRGGDDKPTKINVIRENTGPGQVSGASESPAQLPPNSRPNPHRCDPSALVSGGALGVAEGREAKGWCGPGGAERGGVGRANCGAGQGGPRWVGGVGRGWAAADTCCGVPRRGRRGRSGTGRGGAGRNR